MTVRLLITGATGFVGKNLLPLLNKMNIDVFSITIDEDNTEYENIHWVNCDLLNSNEVEEAMNKIKPTHLLHMAWGMVPSNYNLQSNFLWLDSSINLIKLFKEKGGSRAVIVGSGVEYEWSNVICKENTTPESHATLYGSCKNILRQYSSSFLSSNDISLVWPKLFFLYGPHENELRLVPHIITSLLKGQKAVIRSGELYRDYFYIKDACMAIAKLLFSDFNGVVNVASGEPAKIEDIAIKIANIIGRPDLLSFEKMENKNNSVVIADVDRLRNDVKFFPKYNLNDGLLETVNWWKQKL